jgi:hypothetical protein
MGTVPGSNTWAENFGDSFRGRRSTAWIGGARLVFRVIGDQKVDD